MFNWLKAKPAPAKADIRDTLFGDIPMTEFLALGASASATEPWSSFNQAKQLLDSNDKQATIETLLGVLAFPNLESRFYIQTWHFLRDLGVTPSTEQRKQLLGVVIEVGMKHGVDLIAAYPEHSARYYNYSGSGVVWDRPNPSVDLFIEDLLKSGTVVLQAIGPWEGSRPAAPTNGKARINILSPAGLSFGEGPLATLSKDRLSGPVIAAAMRLMMELMRISKESNSK